MKINTRHLGYMYTIGEKETDTMTVFKTLNILFEELTKYLKDNNLFDDLKYYDHFGRFTTMHEGLRFDPVEIAEYGMFHEGNVITIKCVYVRDD